jgi:hypothetical protein
MSTTLASPSPAGTVPAGTSSASGAQTNTAPASQPAPNTSPPFPDAVRIDARDKVRGAVRYASDDARPPRSAWAGS